MHVPLINFHWLQVNRLGVPKKKKSLCCWFVTWRVWDVETNLERGSGGWPGGEQPCTKQVGKVAFVDPKCHCLALPWVDFSNFLVKNWTRCLAVSLRTSLTVYVCVRYELLRKGSLAAWEESCCFQNLLVHFCLVVQINKSMCTSSSLWAVLSLRWIMSFAYSFIGSP